MEIECGAFSPGTHSASLCFYLKAPLSSSLLCYLKPVYNLLLFCFLSNIFHLSLRLVIFIVCVWGGHLNLPQFSSNFFKYLKFFWHVLDLLLQLIIISPLSIWSPVSVCVLGIWGGSVSQDIFLVTFKEACVLLLADFHEFLSTAREHTFNTHRAKIFADMHAKSLRNLHFSFSFISLFAQRDIRSLKYIDFAAFFLTFSLTHTPLCHELSSLYLSQHIEWSLTKHDSPRPPPVRIELTASSRDLGKHSAHTEQGAEERDTELLILFLIYKSTAADSCEHWTFRESSNSHSLRDSRLPKTVTILCWKTTKMEWRSPVAVIFPPR